MTIEHTPDPNLDDDEDLAAADRGDEFQDDEGEAAASAADDAALAKNPVSGEPRDKAAKESEEEETEEESEEEESEEEESEESEESEEASAAGKGKNLPIRLNKMKEQRDRERERAESAERELEALRQAGKKEPAPVAKDPADEINKELDDLYVKVEEARADGDTKAAAALQRQIDGHNRTLATIDATKVAQKVTSATTERQRFDMLLDTMEASVSALNPESDDFDPDAVKDLELLVGGFERGGLSPSKALHKAVKVLHKVDLNAPAKAARKEPEAKADEEKAPTDKKAAKKPDVKKAVDTQKRQPPDSSRRGSDNDNQGINVSGLSEEEFEKLPDSVKAKYRGDELE